MSKAAERREHSARVKQKRTDRLALVGVMRDEGKTFREIGDTLGITGERANQLYRQVVQRRRHAERAKARTDAQA